MFGGRKNLIVSISIYKQLEEQTKYEVEES